MALLDRVHDVGRLVTIMGNRASHLEVEIKKLKSEGDLEQLAAAHQRVVELQANNTKIMSELGEATQRLDQADRELNKARAELADSGHVFDRIRAVVVDSRAGNLKLVVIGLSCISGVNGEPPFELSPVSSFDLVIAFCASSNHRFTYRSCACTESIESDDKVSGSRGLCSASRWCAIDFSRTDRGLPIEFLVGNLALCGCAELVPWVPESRPSLYAITGAPIEGKSLSMSTGGCG
ncbi:hypothetical protein B296_00021244 [Ensete ventricosum]|uniref:Uncharacterized protein n=1 Tax=Ensete ventricosum TaxID=4639 RepID=A0A427A345_ENSVE|nr:hypothetical protein B296_00021244 [Ensete ventricosum]